jgi:DNA end-binding protein Ku
LRKTSTKHKSQPEPQAIGRPFWSGTISFGLVSIPVNLFPASRDSRISLRLLGPQGQPLKREDYSPETGKDLETPETIRGFETRGGEYVTVTEEELDRLAPEKSRDINLRVFVAQSEISPVYFNRAYILTPADKSAKAYRLLAHTMEESGRAGIATFVMHGKEYLVAILAIDGILRAETLRFEDEIRTPKDIGLPKSKKATAATVRAFTGVIERLSKKALAFDEMRDEYAHRMQNLINAKRERHKDVVESESGGSMAKPAKVVDLMQVLKKSLGQNEKAKRRG